MVDGFTHGRQHAIGIATPSLLASDVQVEQRQLRQAELALQDLVAHLLEQRNSSVAASSVMVDQGETQRLAGLCQCDIVTGLLTRLQCLADLAQRGVIGTKHPSGYP